MASAKLKSIVLTSANSTDAGEYRDAGSELIIGTDISAMRAQDLLDGHRAILPEPEAPASTGSSAT